MRNVWLNRAWHTLRGRNQSRHCGLICLRKSGARVPFRQLAAEFFPYLHALRAFRDISPITGVSLSPALGVAWDRLVTFKGSRRFDRLRYQAWRNRKSVARFRRDRQGPALGLLPGRIGSYGRRRPYLLAEKKGRMAARAQVSLRLERGFSARCAFRPKLPPIPAQSCHLFRLKVATPEVCRRGAATCVYGMTVSGSWWH